MTENEQLLKNLMNEYYETFGDIFPAFQLLGRGDDKCIAIIKRCLRENKDAYDLGYVTTDLNVFY